MSNSDNQLPVIDVQKDLFLVINGVWGELIMNGEKTIETRPGTYDVNILNKMVNHRISLVNWVIDDFVPGPKNITFDINLRDIEKGVMADADKKLLYAIDKDEVDKDNKEKYVENCGYWKILGSAVIREIKRYNTSDDFFGDSDGHRIYKDKTAAQHFIETLDDKKRYETALNNWMSFAGKSILTKNASQFGIVFSDIEKYEETETESKSKTKKMYPEPQYSTKLQRDVIYPQYHRAFHSTSEYKENNQIQNAGKRRTRKNNKKKRSIRKKRNSKSKGKKTRKQRRRTK